MKKRIIIIVSIVVIALGAGVVAYMMYQANQSNDTADEQSTEQVVTGTVEMNDAATETTDQTSTTTNPDSTETVTAGAYVDYSPEAVANTEGQRVLFFHASWCPKCRALDESIKAGEVPAGVTIFKVDYDSNQALRQQYGVTIQTTLILLDDEQKEAKKYIAYDNPTLASLIENLF